MKILLFAKIFIFIFVGNAFCAKDYKKTADLAVAVFKFIYNNEKLCGDLFANSTWLPARHNCELRCRLDTEICQMSSETAMPIRRQRCHGLPAECRRHLKKLVGGAELYTKPNKRRNTPTSDMQKQRKSIGATTNTKTALKSHVKSLLMNNISSTASTPRLVRINTSSARNHPQLLAPELVPLVKDLDEILIHPAQFHTTALPTLLPTKRNVINSRKSLIKPLPTGQPLTMSIPPRPKHVPSPVDDNLQRMFEQLYIEAGTTTTTTTATAAKATGVGDSRTGQEINSTTIVTTKSSIMYSTDTTTVDGQHEKKFSAPLITTKISTTTTVGQQPSTTTTTTVGQQLSTTTTTVGQQHSTTTTTVGQQDWKSAELSDNPPFAGNPFGGAVAAATNLSVVAEAENGTTTTSENAEDKSAQKTVLLSPTYKNEVFGPPLNKIVIDKYGKRKEERHRHHQQQLDSAESKEEGQINRATKSAAADDNYVLKFVEDSTRETRPSPSTTPTTTTAATHDVLLLHRMPKTMEEMDKRQIPWWNWRDLAKALRQRPSYPSSTPTSSSSSTADETGVGDDVGILSLDKSVRCCHWALEGLCDRSWQRVRELCPKSCGSLVCSSIDGTLSCNRAINVDVIACYEQRRRQQKVARSPPPSAQQRATKDTTVSLWPETTATVSTMPDKRRRLGSGAKLESETNSKSAAQENGHMERATMTTKDTVSLWPEATSTVSTTDKRRFGAGAKFESETNGKSAAQENGHMERATMTTKDTVSLWPGPTTKDTVSLWPGPTTKDTVSLWPGPTTKDTVSLWPGPTATVSTTKKRRFGAGAKFKSETNGKSAAQENGHMERAFAVENEMRMFMESSSTTRQKTTFK